MQREINLRPKKNQEAGLCPPELIWCHMWSSERKGQREVKEGAGDCQVPGELGLPKPPAYAGWGAEPAQVGSGDASSCQSLLG